MSQIFHATWNNSNSVRAYPLTEWATKRDTAGQIALPNSFIIGLRLTIDVGLVIDPGRFFLSRVQVVPPAGYNLEISYDNGTDVFAVATTTIPMTHTEGAAYILRGVGDFTSIFGNIVIGSLNDMANLPVGQYAFDYEDGALEIDAITPMAVGVTSVTLVNGLEISERLTGDLVFTAGTNQRITTYDDGSGSTNIMFSAISGEGLNERCDCEDNTSTPLSSVNGVFGDSSRNLTLLGDECISITPIPNGLLLKNNCAKPCCSCKELEAVWSNLDRLDDGAATLRGFVTSLNAETRQLIAALSVSNT